MGTIYAVVDKETDEILGFYPVRNNEFPKKGNDALLYVIADHDTRPFDIISSQHDVFFSSAKKYVDQVDLIPSKSVSKFNMADFIFEREDFPAADYYINE